MPAHLFRRACHARKHHAPPRRVASTPPFGRSWPAASWTSTSYPRRPWTLRVGAGAGRGGGRPAAAPAPRACTGFRRSSQRPWPRQTSPGTSPFHRTPRPRPRTRHPPGFLTASRHAEVPSQLSVLGASFPGAGAWSAQVRMRELAPPCTAPLLACAAEQLDAGSAALV